MSATATGPLRSIGPERTEEYRDLLHSAYAQNLELGVHFAASDATAADIERHLRENLAYAYVDDEDALISTVSLRTPWGPNPGHLGLPHVGWLATRPDHEGKGLARAILRDLEEQVLVGQLHAPAVSLGTSRDHPWLGEYYRRRGFDPLGSRDLGLGHITDFYLRVLDPIAYDGWRTRHADLLKGLSA